MKRVFPAVLGFVLICSMPANGAIEHVRYADGSSQTLYEIEIPAEISPEQVDSVTVLRNGTPLPIGRDDFSLWGFGSFLEGVLWVPGKPTLGTYTFIINAGGTQITTQDTQRVNLDIPSVDVNSLSVQGNTFSWGTVTFADTPLYYRLVIDDSSGNRVYNSARELNMVSHTVPAGTLVPGQTYRWHVRVSDAAGWVSEQNRSNSQYVQLTWGGSIESFWVQHREKEDGENLNRLHFRFRDKSGQYIQTLAAVSDLKLYDPGGQLIALSSMELRYGVDGSYDDTTGQWSTPSLSFEPYVFAEIDGPLTQGTYRLELAYEGGTFRRNYQFNGIVPLPVVSSSGFQITADGNGNLTWTWEVPESLCSTAAQIPNTFTAPVIDIFKQGQEVGWIFIRGPTCLGHFNLPASLVQAINSLGDEFRLHVDVRTTDNNNSAVSAPLVLSRLASYPFSASLQGTVTDEGTGEPISAAVLSFNPGEYQVISGADGNFSSSAIPPATYSVTVTASGYNSKTLASVSLSPGVPNQFNVSLVPYVPKVMSASATPSEVGNDGQGTTLLTARITHPVGLSNIDTVIADLSPIGGSAEQIFYDDGTHGDQTAGDGIYSYQATVAKGTSAKLYALNVTAIDVMEKEGPGSISLSIKDKQSGTVQPNDSRSQSFENTLGGQTLNIHFDFTKATLSLKALRSDCQVRLTVLGPNGEEYGPYSGTDSIDVSIPNAAVGSWEYVTENPCDSALSYEVETSGSGTGLLVGRVVDGLTGVGVKGATINCNTGGSTVSLDQGYYSGVAVAGTGIVTTAKTGYQTNVKSGVHIKSGSTTNLNIQIVSQGAPARAVPSGANVFNILDPADEPKPPAQPFSIKVSGSALEFNAIFPRYAQAVDLYVAFVPSSGAHAGKLFLIDENDSIVEFGGTLHAWKTASTQEESGQIPIPGDYPLGVYTLYSLVTTDSSTLTNFDLSYFTTTPPQPAPVGQNVTFIPSPTDEPNPLTQPLGAKITGGNLILNAHFPMQKEPVSIFLAYMTPAGALYLIKSDGTAELLSGALSPWRQNVTGEVEAQAFSIPTDQMSQGLYYFFSLVTTDPVSLSNFDLLFFSMNVVQ